MKENPIKDERLITARRKIQSDGYQILVLVLLLSVFVQQFLLHAPFSQFAVEFFCLIGCGAYNIVRNFSSGIDIWKSETRTRKNIFVHVLVSGVLAMIILACFSGERRLDNLLLFLVCFVTFSFAFQLLMIRMNKRRQDQINRELEEDDMAE